ncbi:MAG TPA: hypothetical protein VIF62_01490, partial [Labilithrix sp.]
MPRKAALACVLLAAGCSSKPQGFPPGAAADAGARAGEQLALEAPRTAHLVAAARSDRIHFARLKSGVLLSTDVFQFEARDDGE